MVLAGVLSGVLQATCSAMSWDVGEAWLPSAEGALFSRSFTHGSGLGGAADALSLELIARACTAGAPVLCPYDMKPALPVEMSAAIPLKAQESVVAVLVFLSNGQVTHSQETMAFLRSVEDVAERAIALSSASSSPKGIDTEMDRELIRDDLSSPSDDARVPMADLVPALDRQDSATVGDATAPLSYGAMVASRRGLTRAERRASITAMRSGAFSPQRRDSGVSSALHRIQIVSRQSSLMSDAVAESLAAEAAGDAVREAWGVAPLPQSEALTHSLTRAHRMSEPVVSYRPAVRAEMRRMVSMPVALAEKPKGFGAFVATDVPKTRAERRQSLMAHFAATR